MASKNKNSAAVNAASPIYGRVREILDAARSNIARTVNTAQVMANWLIGREIVEEEQKGKRRAGYGEALLNDLSARLTEEFGKGWSIRQLEYCRSFYVCYPQLLGAGNSNAVRSKSATPVAGKAHDISNAVRAECSEVWRPGQLNPNLSWTHYRILLRVSRAEARSFYEVEAVANAWSAREMERQIGSLLFDRLAKSRDKAGLMRLARQGHEVVRPIDALKDPLVLEFLGLPESPRLIESKLEQALIGNLQTFLLELGKGFAFVSRQERNIFTSRYQLYLPTVEELEDELRRELRYLAPPASDAPVKKGSTVASKAASAVRKKTKERP